MEGNAKYVVHVMGMDSSKYGGIERFNVALSEALMKKGCHSLFVYESEPEYQGFVDDLRKSGALVFVSNSRKHPLRFCCDIIRILRQYRPLLVHAHFTKARFYAIPIAYWMGIRKLFFTIHSCMDPKKQIKPLTRWWYDRANKMAKVIAVSDDISRTYIENWPNAHVKRIYLGVGNIKGLKRESREKLGISQSETLILTVANFNHIKGLDVLCKAVKILNDKGKLTEQTCFYIVGQPEEEIKELDKLIHRLGIENMIYMIGISNQVPDYMVSADFYIQPSRSEGLPLALMEAASASLPLIGSKVGGIPEIVKDGINGLLVEAENEQMLADAIGKMLSDTQLRQKYSKSSLRLYHESYSVENGVSQTISYYGL